jgi:hypothetical protein
VIFQMGVVGSCEHAPSLTSPLDTAEAGTLSSGRVLLSLPSAVLWPPPTSHTASPQTSTFTALYLGLHSLWKLRPHEISLVLLMALPAFRSPYAEEFFEAASPDPSPLPWPSRSLKRSALLCSPFRANISTLQDSLYGTDYRVAPPSQSQLRFTTWCHHRQWELATWLSGDYHDRTSTG